ncbi:methyl-accepting chemotaxis protein [Pelotomaculum isophthalicicum JI]|uniref:Methyl-accepting chemotaxis protein n=1 Tax=Pelotomaculum isophthalicicum JI TaxID=947010 RepID=A0A9X4GXV9_9FIRM|nr:methyl-accepting chemotaxis protein [Pelotomaculum isophthalicicum]MDF9407162.1 methyl-accepting chemotaxis protein [Pelotomaculum isophthalicicum JI]
MGRSIKFKFMATIIVILVVALGTLSYFSYKKAQQVLISNFELDLTSLAKPCATEVSLWLDEHRTEINTLANSPIIATGNRDAILSYLTTEQKRFNDYESLLMVDGKGDYYSTDGSTGSISDRDYFKQVMGTGQAVVSDPIVSRVTGHLVVAVAAPLKRDNQVTGLLLGTQPIDEIISELSTIKVGKTGYAYMIQGDGLCIAHPDKNMVMKLNLLKDSSLDSNLTSAAQKMVKGESGVTRYVFEGVDKFIAYAPVAGSKWSLVLTSPVAELSAALRSLAVISIILTLVVLFIAGAVAVVLSNQIVKPILVLKDEFNMLAEKGGDLTQEIKVRSNDETGDLAKAVNQFLANLRAIMLDVKSASIQVAGTSQQLTSSAQQTAAGAGETAVTMGQIAATVDRVSSNTQTVAQASETAAKFAGEGDRGIAKLIGQMQSIAGSAEQVAVTINELSKKSQEINQIVGLITNIADQTNLLALNAAIEAARAGEQGLGFAVVAEEVRKLAEESANATKEIGNLVNAIQAESQRAVESMAKGGRDVEAGTIVIQEVGDGFKNIISSVQSLTEEIQSVAAATEEVSAGVQNVAAATQEQTAAMEEVSASAESLSKLSEELDAIVGKFKI